MESTNPVNYLFAAFSAVWVILALYLYSIHSRERNLRDEVKRLKESLDKK